MLVLPLVSLGLGCSRVLCNWAGDIQGCSRCSGEKQDAFGVYYLNQVAQVVEP